MPRPFGVLPRRAKGGLLRYELWVDACVAILHEGQTLLAPECQFQQDRNGYYRRHRRCDKSSYLP